MAAWVVAAIEVGGDGKTRFGFGGSGVVEDLLVGVQRFSRPVSRHLGKEPVFDGVPLGSPGRIMCHGNAKGEGIGQLRLQLCFPGIAAIAVAPSGVGQDENLTRAGIAMRTFLLPPVSDGMGGEGRGVVRNAHDEGTAILGEVVDAIGDGDADGVGAEVVVKDASGAAFPTAAGIAEIANQFALLGIHADDGQVTALEAVTQIGEIFELEIPIRAVTGGDLFVIHAQRIPHLIEQPRDGVGADADAELAQFLGDSGGGAARPPQACHGVAGGVVLQQAV